MARVTTRVTNCPAPTEAARFWPRLAAKIAVALGTCSLAAVLFAQAPAPAPTPLANPFGPDETDEGFKYHAPAAKLSGSKGRQEEQRYRNKIRQTLNTGQPPITDATVRFEFDGYFQRYLFPLMTTQEGLKTLATDRGYLLSDLANAKDQTAHNYLANLTLASMTKLVRDSYRPPTRYNAMLIISSLNEVESRVLPEPMAAALPVIQQEFERPENSSEVRLAALIGLSRHLEFDNFKTANQLPAATKSAIIDSIIKLAENKEAAADCTPDAQVWLRRRAVEALGYACLIKTDQKVIACFNKLLRDDSDNPQLRCAVAATLGKMNLQAPANLDPVDMAKELGHLALVICDTELTRFTKVRREDDEHIARLSGTYVGGEPGVGPGGLRGAGSGDGGVRQVRPPPGTGGEAGMPPDPSTLDPKQYRYDYARRRMRQQLYCVQLGLTGGHDFPPPKLGGASSPPGGSGVAGGATGAAGADNAGKSGSSTGPGAPEEKRGVLAVAKAPPDRDVIIDIYRKVRKLIEDIEVRPSDTTSIDKLDTVVRRDMKLLEPVSRKLAAAPTPAVATDEEPAGPAAPKSKPPKGPPGKAGPKGPPGKPGIKSTGPSRLPAGAIPTGSKGR